VASECSFALAWDAAMAITIRGRGDRSREVALSSRGGTSTFSCDRDANAPTGRPRPDVEMRCDLTGDQLDLCLPGPCPRPTRGSLFVRVVAKPGVLAANAQVQVRAGEQEVGTCTAPSGACFVHHLPTGQALTVEARAPNSKAPVRTSAQARAGVTELTVRLP
jgi:hypothetical protein